MWTTGIDELVVQSSQQRSWQTLITFPPLMAVAPLIWIDGTGLQYQYTSLFFDFFNQSSSWYSFGTNSGRPSRWSLTIYSCT
jgi:hypothetical protein